MQAYIRSQSYQTATGHWVPSLYILKDCGEESLEQSFSWHDHLHSTQEAADDFAVHVARASRIIE